VSPTWFRSRLIKSRLDFLSRSNKPEADKSEKTKGRLLKGSMVLSNPIISVPGQRETVVGGKAVSAARLKKENCEQL
jgi:hypothetical protein